MRLQRRHNTKTYLKLSKCSVKVSITISFLKILVEFNVTTKGSVTLSGNFSFSCLYMYLYFAIQTTNSIVASERTTKSTIQFDLTRSYICSSK